MALFSEVAPLLLAALRLHERNPLLCSGLRNLCRGPDVIHELVVGGAIRTVVDALRINMVDAGAATDAVSLLGAFAAAAAAAAADDGRRDDAGAACAAAVVAEGAAPAVLAAFSRHVAIVELSRVACAALTHMAAASAETRELLVSESAGELLAGAVRLHASGSFPFVDEGAALLAELARCSAGGKAQLLREDAPRALVTLLKRKDEGDAGAVGSALAALAAWGGGRCRTLVPQRASTAEEPHADSTATAAGPSADVAVAASRLHLHRRCPARAVRMGAVRGGAQRRLLRSGSWQVACRA